MTRRAKTKSKKAHNDAAEQKKIDKAMFDIFSTMSEPSERHGEPIKDGLFTLGYLERNTEYEDIFLHKIMHICVSKSYLKRFKYDELSFHMTEKGVKFFNEEKKRGQRGWVKKLNDSASEYKTLLSVLFAFIGVLIPIAIFYLG